MDLLIALAFVVAFVYVVKSSAVGRTNRDPSPPNPSPVFDPWDEPPRPPPKRPITPAEPEEIPILKITETSGKPVNIFYNDIPIAYVDNVVVNLSSNRPFEDVPTEATIRLQHQAPYEIRVDLAYSSMKLFNAFEELVFDSETTFHPGNKFVVSQPMSTVRLKIL